ncbi:MAG: hypothetical protein HWQ42_11435 [Nostoc sp. JL23]|uniref:hypothetical protein n=1 Tax=Nostoc sp. TaxID=1180 RepID=UPI001DBBF3FB|nr:hypothetical protein [Nostoc sp. JL23]
MKKRTAYSYGEASYAQRLVREGAKDTKDSSTNGKCSRGLGLRNLGTIGDH